MSTLPSSENRKQPPSVYTVMLLLSMLFMLIAVIAMWMELNAGRPITIAPTPPTRSVMVMPADHFHLG